MPGSQRQKLPQRVLSLDVLLLLGVRGGQGAGPQACPAFRAGVSDTGFLENGEKRIFAQMLSTSPNLPLGIEYTGP